ncbi:MAG: hypothetical protein IJW19_07620 [Clostridia bacterium]|nr:hypothetical protein [Clostridia bacterium]
MSQENSKLKPHSKIIIILFIVGITLLIIGSFAESRATATTENNIEEYIESTEAKLEKFLLEVKGIKSVRVIITAEAFSNVDRYGQSNETQSATVIKGVVVACTNGDRSSVKAEVTDIVSKYLGIGTNKIKVTDIKQ